MSKPLAELMHANVLEVGLPEWTEQDQELARAVQTMMGRDEANGLPTESVISEPSALKIKEYAPPLPVNDDRPANDHVTRFVVVSVSAPVSRLEPPSRTRP